MFSGQIIVYYCVYIRCGCLLHLDTEAIQFLYFVLSLKLYYAVMLLSSCNCREAKQLLRAQLCSVCILSSSNMKGKPPTEYFEMNLPYCLIADLVKQEMEAIGQHIQVLLLGMQIYTRDTVNIQLTFQLV